MNGRQRQALGLSLIAVFVVVYLLVRYWHVIHWEAR